MVLWPGRPHDTRQASLAAACRALSDSFSTPSSEDASVRAAVAAVVEVHRTFQAAPWGERAAITEAVVDLLHASTRRLEGSNALAAHLDEAFRLRLVSYGAHQIAVHTLLATGAKEPDTDAERLYPGEHRLGRLSAAPALASDHLSIRSVWFRNSLRGAAGLAVAVVVGQLLDVQHAFWVVLGALSVLRSNALSTGSTVVRALAGTFVGIIVGGILLTAIGTEPRCSGSSSRRRSYWPPTRPRSSPSP